MNKKIFISEEFIAPGFMRFTLPVLFCLCLMAGTSSLKGQQAPKKIRLLHANTLKGGTHKGEEVRKLIGNVAFEHKKAVMHCDSAYQYPGENMIRAYSNVRIEQGDSLTLTGDTLLYKGDTRIATMRGNVILKDGETTLHTPFLKYNMKTKTGHYFREGKILDKDNTLTSQSGTYNTETKQFAFRNNVVLENPDYTIYSDTLLYNSGSKKANFEAPTLIETEDGTIKTHRGTYNTQTKVSTFRKQAQIENKDYRLSGDSIYYEEHTKFGIAKKNVRLTLKEDSVTITGDYGYHWGKEQRTKVFDNAMLKKRMNGDTLYLNADTLVALDDSVQAKKRLLAFNNVKILKRPSRGICDSLAYLMKDSTIHLYRDPVLWYEDKQLTSDSIYLKLRDGNIDRFYTRVRSFVISQDTLENFNQVKGDRMTGYFHDNNLRKIMVNGNAESIYFALEGDTLLQGMNRSQSSNLRARFKANKLQSITYLRKPEARFVPPHELQEPDKRLKGFRWRIKEKPADQEIIVPGNASPQFPVIHRTKKKTDSMRGSAP